MSAKYSPGPWIATKLPTAGLHGYFFRIGNHKGTSGHIASTVGSTERDEANARLIAASPDLAEALHTLAEEAAGIVEMARESIGNTNANCLMQRIKEACAALKKAGIE